MPFVESGSSVQSRNANDIIEEVIRLMLSGQREQMNKLAGNVGANASTLTFQYDLGGIAEGGLINIDTEVFRVWEANRELKTVTVEPAMLGSTSAPHTAGSLVYVNPRIPRHSALTALNNELGGLSAPTNGLYAVAFTEFDYSSAVTDYNLDTDGDLVLDVLAVRQQMPGAEQHWIDLNDWRYRRNSDATSFAAGQSIFLPLGVPGRRVQVVYSTPFKTVDSINDDIASTTGLPSYAQDILVHGTLLQLGVVREIKRNFTESQGDTRRAGEVPATAVGNSFSYVRAQRAQRIQEEAGRLMRLYPPRRRT